MTFESVLSFDFTRTCHFKALFGTGFSFHFRHFLPVFNYLTYYFFLALKPKVIK
ncbi:hypothetical protein NU09_3381 [Flavobacterium beibuense]|uniref:Uncharacterized protein n=1 Tax=Flavobacterium beibuense TaxID=657326 RepID=A0A444W3T2_9FLAO|nr:hypothetical protein NU09_3381 [Flavobacterium beibuense]